LESSTKIFLHIPVLLKKLIHLLRLINNDYDINTVWGSVTRSVVALYIIFVLFKVTLGTISNVDEAVQWLSYTYLFVRMKINPQCYGINYQDVHVSCSWKSSVIKARLLSCQYL
jgi:hypothetical protein